jgi:hypothetical protein
MPGFTAVASRRALSAGTLLVFGGGLALYQMTSLWLGPAGSREFHLSLTMPAVEEELSEPRTSDLNLALGTLVASRPAASASVRSTGASGAAGAHRQAAPAPVPIGAQALPTHPSALPLPPATVPKGDKED